MSVWVKKREERKREQESYNTHTHIHTLICPECGSSKIVKDGIRYLNDGSQVQRWVCGTCFYSSFQNPLKGREPIMRVESVRSGKIRKTLIPRCQA